MRRRAPGRASGGGTGGSRTDGRVLYGPKGAGKSWAAAALLRRADVHHVDPDQLVLELLALGARPDPRRGWLDDVEAEVRRSLEHHARVSVEATGAWDSDWTLADDLAADGCRVLSVWVTAPLEVTLARLAGRGDDRIAVSADEARAIHDRATRAAAARSFAARVDTAETSRAAREVNDLVRLLG